MSSYTRKMFVPRRIKLNEKFHYNVYELKKKKKVVLL